LGKQIPYVGVALINFVILFLMAVFVFDVPFQGSFPTLAAGALLYAITTTGYGMLISSFARTQIAALFGTAILTVIPATQFSGMLTPVSSLTGVGAIIGNLFPMTYFLKINIGTFTKGLGFQDLTDSLVALAVTVPVLTIASLTLLRSQDR
jgi:ribosome-dependent ATPase